jgi:hypothetical protein
MMMMITIIIIIIILPRTVPNSTHKVVQYTGLIVFLQSYCAATKLTKGMTNLSIHSQQPFYLIVNHVIQQDALTQSQYHIAITRIQLYSLSNWH